jgi:hypothetical protein
MILGAMDRRFGRFVIVVGGVPFDQEEACDQDDDSAGL